MLIVWIMLSQDVSVRPSVCRDPILCQNG